jgi:hypothetical protein
VISRLTGPQWVAIALLLGACDSGPESGPVTTAQEPAVAAVATVRDSAGIVVRTTAAAALSQVAHRPSVTPVLALDGSEDGGAPFHAIGAVAFTPAGELAIAERGEMTVRIHGPDGRRLRTVGREGEGPGEFGALNGLGFRRDSMLVYDSRWSRISVFDANGEYVRQIQPEADWGSFPRWAGVAPDVGIFTRAQRRGADLIWGLHDFEGTPLGALADVPAPPTPTMTTIGHPSGDAPLPPLVIFGARPNASPIRRGIAAFRGENHEVLLFDHAGALIEVWRVEDGKERPVTQHDVAAARDRALSASDPERRPALRRRWTDVEAPARFPALGSAAGFAFSAPPEIIEARDGDVWVHGYPTSPAEPRLWWVFSAEGTLRGSVELPPRFELHAVAEEGALGIELDEFDVERVVLYALAPG